MTHLRKMENQIYVRPFPELDKGCWQVSTRGENSPLWSRSGQELFYRNDDAVIGVMVKTDPIVSAETPGVLFRGHYSYGSGGNYSSFSMTEVFSRVTWDISPDGTRFLMMKEAGPISSESGGPRRINIVVNWLQDLKNGPNEMSA